MKPPQLVVLGSSAASSSSSTQQARPISSHRQQQQQQSVRSSDDLNFVVQQLQQRSARLSADRRNCDGRGGRGDEAGAPPTETLSQVLFSFPVKKQPPPNNTSQLTSAAVVAPPPPPSLVPLGARRTAPQKQSMSESSSSSSVSLPRVGTSSIAERLKARRQEEQQQQQQQTRVSVSAAGPRPRPPPPLSATQHQLLLRPSSATSRSQQQQQQQQQNQSLTGPSVSALCRRFRSALSSTNSGQQQQQQQSTSTSSSSSSGRVPLGTIKQTAPAPPAGEIVSSVGDDAVVVEDDVTNEEDDVDDPFDEAFLRGGGNRSTTKNSVEKSKPVAKEQQQQQRKRLLLPVDIESNLIVSRARSLLVCAAPGEALEAVESLLVKQDEEESEREKNSLTARHQALILSAIAHLSLFRSDAAKKCIDQLESEIDPLFWSENSSSSSSSSNLNGGDAHQNRRGAAPSPPPGQKRNQQQRRGSFEAELEKYEAEQKKQQQLQQSSGGWTEVICWWKVAFNLAKTTLSHFSAICSQLAAAHAGATAPAAAASRAMPHCRAAVESIAAGYGSGAAGSSSLSSPLPRSSADSIGNNHNNSSPFDNLAMLRPLVLSQKQPASTHALFRLLICSSFLLRAICLFHSQRVVEATRTASEVVFGLLTTAVFPASALVANSAASASAVGNGGVALTGSFSFFAWRLWFAFAVRDAALCPALISSTFIAKDSTLFRPSMRITHGIDRVFHGGKRHHGLGAATDDQPAATTTSSSSRSASSLRQILSPSPIAASATSFNSAAAAAAATDSSSSSSFVECRHGAWLSRFRDSLLELASFWSKNGSESLLSKLVSAEHSVSEKSLRQWKRCLETLESLLEEEQRLFFASASSRCCCCCVPSSLGPAAPTWLTESLLHDNSAAALTNAVSSHFLLRCGSTFSTSGAVRQRWFEQIALSEVAATGKSSSSSSASLRRDKLKNLAKTISSSAVENARRSLVRDSSGSSLSSSSSSFSIEQQLTVCTTLLQWASRCLQMAEGRQVEQKKKSGSNSNSSNTDEDDEDALYRTRLESLLPARHSLNDPSLMSLNRRQFFAAAAALAQVCLFELESEVDEQLFALRLQLEQQSVVEQSRAQSRANDANTKTVLRSLFSSASSSASSSPFFSNDNSNSLLTVQTTAAGAGAASASSSNKKRVTAATQQSLSLLQRTLDAEWQPLCASLRRAAEACVIWFVEQQQQTQSLQSSSAAASFSFSRHLPLAAATTGNKSDVAAGEADEEEKQHRQRLHLPLSGPLTKRMISRAMKQRALTWHPDRQQKEEDSSFATQQFTQIHSSYQFLLGSAAVASEEESDDN